MTALLVMAILLTASLPAPAGVWFGFYDWWPDGDWLFTATRLTVGSVAELDAMPADWDGMLLVNLVTRPWYIDEYGCFSVDRWKKSFDMADHAALARHVRSGLVWGLFAADEPHWEQSRHGCGPSGADLDEICQHVHMRVPDLRCGFNAPPSWLLEVAPVGGYRHVDYVLSHSNFAVNPERQDWARWARQQLDDAQRLGDVPVLLGVNGYSYDPTAYQIVMAVTALCAAQPTGVLVWSWRERTDYWLEGAPFLKIAAAVCADQLQQQPRDELYMPLIH